MRAKICINILYRLKDIYIIGLSFMKFFLFYFHLLIYDEFIISYFDIIKLVLIFLFLVNFGYFINIIRNNTGNYYFCFNNKIENNKIIRKSEKNLIKYYFFAFILPFVFNK